MFEHKLSVNTELRLIEPIHAEQLFELIDSNRERLGRWMIFVENVISVDGERAFARNGLHQFADGRGYHCGIWRDSTLLGSIGIFPIDLRNRIAEIGYWLDAEAEGKGIMTLACKAVLDDLFNRMNVNRAVIKAVTPNSRSRAIPERLGFKHESTERQSALLQGSFVDHEVYSLLKEESTIDHDNNDPSMFVHTIDDDTVLTLSEPAHAEEMFALIDRNREHLGKWLQWVDITNSEDDTRLFRMAKLHEFADTGNFSAAIWHRGAFAGMINLASIDWRNLSGEIGYWIGCEFEGKGLITKSCRAILDHAFNNLGLNRIVIKAETENLRSRAVPERLGFKHEGTIRQAAKFRDRFVDHEVYAMLREEWGGR